MESAAVGIFGVVCAREFVFADGDRIEIYRPLAVDPRAARRERAAGAKRRAGFGLRATGKRRSARCRVSRVDGVNHRTTGPLARLLTRRQEGRARAARNKPALWLVARSPWPQRAHAALRASACAAALREAAAASGAGAFGAGVVGTMTGVATFTFSSVPPCRLEPDGELTLLGFAQPAALQIVEIVPA